MPKSGSYFYKGQRNRDRILYFPHLLISYLPPAFKFDKIETVHRINVFKSIRQWVLAADVRILESPSQNSLQKIHLPLQSGKNQKRWWNYHTASCVMG